MRLNNWLECSTSLTSKLWLFVLAFSFFSFSKEKEIEKRVEAHLILEDPRSAVQEAKEGLELYPDSTLLLRASIFSLAEMGEEKQALAAWKQYQKLSKEALEDRYLIEEMAWGILQKAAKSSSLGTRQIALLAAFFSQDRKGVRLLLEGMKDQNYAIRALSTKFAANLRDQPLAYAVKRLFLEEKNHIVRLECIKAIGSMKIQSFKEKLRELIACQNAHTQERAAAIQSFIQLSDTLERKEIEILANSPQSGHRQLAAKAIGYFQCASSIDLLVNLAEDCHSEVKIAALDSLSYLLSEDTKKQIEEVAARLCNKPTTLASIGAAKLLVVLGNDQGTPCFDYFFEQKELQLPASLALAKTGSKGLELMQKHFEASTDPLVKLNLAIGILRQQVLFEKVFPFLSEFVLSFGGKLSKNEEGLFSGYCEASSDSSVSPEVEDQIARLELIGLLAAYEAKEAEKSAKKYLQTKTWGVSASAAAVLLTEGREECVPLIESLLDDPSESIRIQAALVLSLFTRDEKIVSILESSYKGREWEVKAKILESIGRIGMPRSLPFLIERLEEPAESLRLIAAVAIIQVLNH